MHWFSLAGLTFAALFPLVNPFAALPLFASLTQDGPASWRKEMAVKAAVYVFVILIVTEFVGNGLLNFFGLSLGMLQIAGGLIVANTAWQMSTGSPRISQKEEHHVKRKVFHAMKESTVHAVAVAKTSMTRATHDATDAMASLPGHLIPGNTTDSTAGSAEVSSSEPAEEPDSIRGDSSQSDSGHNQEHKKPGAFPDISFSPMAMPMLAGPGSMGVVIGIVTQNKGVADSFGIALGIVAIALLSMLTLLAATPINRSLGASGVMVLQRVFGFITLGIAVALVSTGISSLFGIPLVN